MENFTIVAVNNYSHEIIVKDIKITDKDMLDNEDKLYDYLGDESAEFQQNLFNTILLNETNRKSLKNLL